ncbi:MAG: transglutaminase TgpA family protein [Kofleriaceae bacterium]
MRFAVAHKTSSYLMVGFAYLAMVTGGGVSGPIALGGALALAASWWWEPPRIRYETWSWAWATASVVALLYSVLTAILTTDFLGIAAQFLVWLTVVKGFNRRAARDWQQLYLLAFLMLVAGSVLNADLTYGLCFLGFVISSTWALTLFHLRREMEDNLLVKHAADRASERVEVRRILDSRRIVGGRFFFGTGALSFGVFVGAAVVFLALPRVGVGFFLKSRGGLTLAGFSDGVKLGGHGVIKSDPTVVMRVEIDGAHGGRDRPPIHWRGVAFDRYRDGQWSRTPGSPYTRQTLEQGRARDRRFLLWAHRAVPARQIDELAATAVKQEIWLEPLDSNVLFGASNPRILEYAHTLRSRRQPAERNDEIRLEHGSTIHYTVYSELAPPPVDELRAASGPLPAGFGVYTELPPEITPETRALARQITAGLTTSYDKAVAIQRYLGEHLRYTLELADPGRIEPVHHFLFDRKEGHCEYFASAFAVLARAADPPIPVRQVNGFLGGEWNEYQGYVAVRAGDAHSWAEVFFPGVGDGGAWVTFDPTPAGGDRLGRGGSGWRARLGRFLDTLRFQWSKWVIEYDLASQLALFKSIGRALEGAAVAVKLALVAAAAWVVERWWAFAPLLAGGAWLWLRRRRRRPARDRGEPRAAPRGRTTIGELFDQATRSLARAGIQRERGVTPRELADQMIARGAPAAEPMRELVELYYAAEWGGRRDAPAEARAFEVAREVRAQLERSGDRKARRR